MATAESVTTVEDAVRKARHGHSDWLHVTTVASGHMFRRVSEDALVDACRTAEEGGKVVLIAASTGRLIDYDAGMIHSECYGRYGTQASRSAPVPLKRSWWHIEHREGDAMVWTYALGTRPEVEWAIREREFRDVAQLIPVNDTDVIKALDEGIDDDVNGCPVVCIGDLMHYHRGM